MARTLIPAQKETGSKKPRRQIDTQAAHKASKKSGGIGRYTAPSTGGFISEEYNKLKDVGITKTIKYTAPDATVINDYDKFAHEIDEEIGLRDASLTEHSDVVPDNDNDPNQSWIYNFGYSVVGPYSSSFETLQYRPLNSDSNLSINSRPDQSCRSNNAPRYYPVKSKPLLMKAYGCNMPKKPYYKNQNVASTYPKIFRIVVHGS